MGENTQSQSRIQFHKKSRARNYRCKPNNVVKSFYVKRLSYYSYVNPEDPAHGYNLRSTSAKNPDTSAIQTDMDHVVVSLVDVIELLSEITDPRGLSVREIREKLIQSKKISEKATDAHVRYALKKGIKTRRIKKIVVDKRNDHRRSSLSSCNSDLEDSDDAVRGRKRAQRASIGEGDSASYGESDSSFSRDSRSRSGSRKSVSKRMQSADQEKGGTRESSSKRSRSRTEISSSFQAASGRSKSRERGDRKYDRCRHRRRDSRNETKENRHNRHDASKTRKQ